MKCSNPTFKLNFCSMFLCNNFISNKRRYLEHIIILIWLRLKVVTTLPLKMKSKSYVKNIFLSSNLLVFHDKWYSTILATNFPPDTFRYLVIVHISPGDLLFTSFIWTLHHFEQAFLDHSISIINCDVIMI